MLSGVSSAGKRVLSDLGTALEIAPEEEGAAEATEEQEEGPPKKDENGEEVVGS